jgi:hypothetical protein
MVKITNQKLEETRVFDLPSVPPLAFRKEFSLTRWEKIRDSGIAPAFCTDLQGSSEKRREFLRGAALMGFANNPDTLKPQQLRTADLLNTDLDSFVIESPRRASKTTSILLALLGRCDLRPGYQVTFSAQSGVASSRRFREWANRLDQVNPPMFDDPTNRPRPISRHLALFGDDPTSNLDRGFRILRGAANQRIEWANGSSFIVLRPEASSYRGEAADVSWIDEAQEILPADGEDLLAAILPLQDTKVGAALILSGTAGEMRTGIFWDYLTRGRDMDPTVGILDYAAPEDTPWEIIEIESEAMALLRTVHPGIGTLTTMDKMLKNYRSMSKPQWAREYLSMWPETFGITAVKPDQWTHATLKTKKAKPVKVAFGLAIKPGGSVASIVAAWRDRAGAAYVEVVEHRQGTAWLPKRMQELTQTYRGSTVAYDDIGEGKATAVECAPLQPRVRLKMQTYRETAAGCIQLLRDLDRGTLYHFDQISLNEAVVKAGKREIRGDHGQWLWTTLTPGDDITSLDAATRALRNWDQYFSKSPTAKPAGIIVG